MLKIAKDIVESILQRQILHYLNALPNCKAVKVMKANEEGMPDIFCCYRGTMIAIEVKASEEDARVSREHQKRQAMQLEQWGEAGAFTMYAWDVEQVEKFVGWIGTKL